MRHGVSLFSNLSATVLYGLAAGHFNEQEEVAILDAARERRIDEARASAICDALTPPDDEGDGGDDDAGGGDDAEAAAAEDSEISAIFDGPPPAVPPPAPLAAPPDFALAKFNDAVTALKQLMTKSAVQFAKTIHSANDLEAVESFIRAVADRVSDAPPPCR
jgi:hypothetical protein